jgi:hypothetical protein
MRLAGEEEGGAAAWGRGHWLTLAVLFLASGTGMHGMYGTMSFANFGLSKDATLGRAPPPLAPPGCPAAQPPRCHVRRHEATSPLAGRAEGCRPHAG